MRVMLLIPLLLALWGCRPPRAQVEIAPKSPPFKIRSAAKLLAQAMPQNDGYKTLTTIHRVTLEVRQKEGRMLKYNFRGALAVKRPDQFRLQILGAMGLKLADLRFAAGRSETLFLSSELKKSAVFLKVIPSIIEDIRGIYRIKPDQPIDHTTLSLQHAESFKAPPQYVVSLYYKNCLVRKMKFLSTTLAITSSERKNAQAGFCQMEFGSWTKQGKYLIPKRIMVKRTRPFVYRLNILVESIKMNVDLNPEMFSQ